MERFNKKIQVEKQGELNFYFTDTSSVLDRKYFVTVTDKQRKSYRFDMREINGERKIAGNAAVPEWIAAVEKELAQTINSQ